MYINFLKINSIIRIIERLRARKATSPAISRRRLVLLGDPFFFGSPPQPSRTARNPLAFFSLSPYSFSKYMHHLGKRNQPDSFNRLRTSLVERAIRCSSGSIPKTHPTLLHTIPIGIFGFLGFF